MRPRGSAGSRARVRVARGTPAGRGRGGRTGVAARRDRGRGAAPSSSTPKRPCRRGLRCARRGAPGRGPRPPAARPRPSRPPGSASCPSRHGKERRRLPAQRPRRGRRRRAAQGRRRRHARRRQPLEHRRLPLRARAVLLLVEPQKDAARRRSSAKFEFTLPPAIPSIAAQARRARRPRSSARASPSSMAVRTAMGRAGRIARPYAREPVSHFPCRRAPLDSGNWREAFRPSHPPGDDGVERGATGAKLEYLQGFAPNRDRHGQDEEGGCGDARRR